MEGKFSREGLQSLDEDDDMLTAMARELVTENGVGESAAAVWRQIQAENSNTVIPRPSARACAGCRGCAADNVAGHAGPDRRASRQSSEVRVTPAIGAGAATAEGGTTGR